MTPALTRADAQRLQACLAGGGLAVYPADTVYGLGCSAHDGEAVRRLYALKRRPLQKPCALMCFSLERALELLDGVGPRTLRAARALLPGAVTLLVPDPGGRLRPAGMPPAAALGLRVPSLGTALQALHEVDTPLLSTSANLAGGSEARRFGDVDPALRSAVDLVLDGGELPGVASTVIDLLELEETGAWRVTRPGAVGPDAVACALG